MNSSVLSKHQQNRSRSDKTTDENSSSDDSDDGEYQSGDLVRGKYIFFLLNRQYKYQLILILVGVLQVDSIKEEIQLTTDPSSLRMLIEELHEYSLVFSVILFQVEQI